MREKFNENAIKEYVRRANGYVTKVQSGKVLQDWKGKTRAIHMAQKGTPDLMGCINGRFIAIEVKRSQDEVDSWNLYPLGKRGKPVKYNDHIYHQKLRRTEIQDAGGLHIIAHCIEDVEDALLMAGVIDRKYTLF